MRVSGSLSPLPEGFTYRLDLARAATSRLLKQRPVHRWFYFPHSYSPELVEAVLDTWELQTGSHILDPFVGAGTTLLVAGDRGYNALGLDLLPLAVLVSNAKSASYDPQAIQTALLTVMDTAQSINEWPGEIPVRLARALTEAEYTLLWRLRRAILQFNEPVRGFMLLALLNILPQFSRAVANGGWFRWVEKSEQTDLILPTFRSRVQQMLDEIEEVRSANNHCGHFNQTVAIRHDARRIHSLERTFDGLITSPPYPNRHDYTRVFQIELLILGHSEDGISQLRHNSLRSHVEAHPPDSMSMEGYHLPGALRACLDKMPSNVDQRIPRMLRGYFEDMYLVLRSAKRSMRPNGRLALVVGNVRHAGVLIPVDEVLAMVGEMAGLHWTETWVIRLRGNSAQQMGKYGRVPSRESIVLFNSPQ
jgi:tRNA G10  N-methylase Trm11